MELKHKNNLPMQHLLTIYHICNGLLPFGCRFRHIKRPYTLNICIFVIWTSTQKSSAYQSTAYWIDAHLHSCHYHIKYLYNKYLYFYMSSVQLHVIHLHIICLSITGTLYISAHQSGARQLPENVHKYLHVTPCILSTSNTCFYLHLSSCTYCY